MILPQTVAAALAGQTIRGALLAKFEFASATERMWQGNHVLTAGGHQWKPGGKYVSVDGLSSRADMAAEPLVFKLSGVDAALVTLAKNSADEVKGRPCTVYAQFFDEDWQTLDSPLALRSGVMDQMSYEAIGPDQRVITLTAEGIFAARGAAPFAFYTDRDQQARFPGDLGLEAIGSMLNRTVTWPDF